MRKVIFMPLLFFLLCNFVFAEDSYPYFGGVGFDYFSGDVSLFNEFIENDRIADVIALNDPQQVPLVSDLDGDGINEIVVLAGGNLDLYHVNQSGAGVDFVGLGGFSTSAVVDGDYYSNVVIYDIDSDSRKEVIFHSHEAGYLYILDWNGSHLVDEGYSFSGFWDVVHPARSADSLIGCGDVDGCVIVYNDYNRFAAGTRYIWARSFNQSNVSQHEEIIGSSALGTPQCLPKYGSVPYGNDRYYFTYGYDPNDVWLAEIIVNESFHTSTNRVLNSHSPSGIGLDCSRGVYVFTSPTLVEFTTSGTVGTEIGYGFQTSTDKFKMVVYDISLNEVDDFPEVFQAEGRIISNPFVASAFVDTEGTDLCVMGYDQTEKEIDILCASHTTGVLGIGLDNVQFFADVSSREFNITASNIWSVASHSLTSKSATLISQVLTSYGVFELEDYTQSWGLCKGYGSCDATLLWDQPIQQEVAILSVDMTGGGFEDMLALTETNLYYIDDGFINRNAYLGYCTEIQPSPDAIWQIHKEDTVQTDIKFPTSYDLINGSLLSGGVLDLQNYDGNELRYSEVLSGGEFRHETDFVFPVGCDGDINSLEITIQTSESPNIDNSAFYLYNYDSFLWDLILTQSLDGLTEFNLSISLPVDLSSYLMNGTGFKVKHGDVGGLGDVGINYIYIDYMALVCSSVIPSNKTNKVKVTVRPVDPENNIVAGRAILYYGEDNAQDTGWSINYSSGTEIPINSETGVTFYPNRSTSGSTLRIYVRDSENYFSEPVYQDFNFIVQSEGHITYDSSKCVGVTEEEYEGGIRGACVTDDDCSVGFDCIDGLCVALPDICNENSDCPDNYICNESFQCEALPSEDDNILIDNAKNLSVITGIPLSILILIIFGVILYGIYREPHIPNNVKLPTSIILSLVVMGVAVKIGLLSYIWIVLLILTILGGIAVLVAKVMGDD